MRYSLNCIFTRQNLSLKGIDIPSILCPVCSNSVEILNHAFGGCLQLGRIWGAIGRWLDVIFPSNKGPESIVDWLESVSWLKKKKMWPRRLCLLLVGSFGELKTFGSREGYRDLIFLFNCFSLFFMDFIS